MLTCGEEIAGPKKTAGMARPLDANMMMAKLPPGHPPLGGTMSGHAFLRAQIGLPSAPAAACKAADSCGNCGMSAAAMAAGEACEHEKK